MSIYLCSCWSAVISFWSVRSFVFGFSSHCHIIITRQPIFFSEENVISSRSILPDILSLQKSWLVSGIVAYLQSECPCQKHPLMNITVLYLGRTMSGLPGNPFWCNRKRKPFANKKRRTKTSGLVFLLLMCDIHFWRCSFDSTSAIKRARTFPVGWLATKPLATTRKSCNILYIGYNLHLAVFVSGKCSFRCKTNIIFWDLGHSLQR